MKKNETQFYFNTNLAKNNFINLKNVKLKKNNFTSRNSFFQIKNKISSRFKFFTNSTIFNKKTLNKKEYISKRDINLNRKNISSNSVHINSNFLKKISLNNNKNKIFESKTYYMKNNTNFMSTINISKINNIKKDSIKHKILLRQRNDNNPYQREDYVFFSYYFKNKNPFINNIRKYFMNGDKSNKFIFNKRELNVRLVKDKTDSFSIFSFNKFNIRENKTNSIKNIPKKYRIINILNRARKALFDSKMGNLRKEKFLIEKSKENK